MFCCAADCTLLLWAALRSASPATNSRATRSSVSGPSSSLLCGWPWAPTSHLTREHVKALESQDKNIAILIVEESAGEHCRGLRRCREQLRLKGPPRSSPRPSGAGRVNGGDMAPSSTCSKRTTSTSVSGQGRQRPQRSSGWASVARVAEHKQQACTTKFSRKGPRSSASKRKSHSMESSLMESSPSRLVRRWSAPRGSPPFFGPVLYIISSHSSSRWFLSPIDGSQWE